MANKQYERVNWAAYPSKTTPISADNLNRMDKGIDDVDTKTTNLETRQDNYEAEMTNVKSNILKLSDSLSGMEFTVIDGKPMWKNESAGADTFAPFKSSAKVGVTAQTASYPGIQHISTDHRVQLVACYSRERNYYYGICVIDEDGTNHWYTNGSYACTVSNVTDDGFDISTYATSNTYVYL